MIVYILIVIYFLMALAVGRRGEDTRLGYTGTAILSLVITPPLVAFLIYGLKPARRLIARG